MFMLGVGSSFANADRVLFATQEQCPFETELATGLIEELRALDTRFISVRTRVVGCSVPPPQAT